MDWVFNAAPEVGSRLILLISPLDPQLAAAVAKGTEQKRAQLHEKLRSVPLAGYTVCVCYIAQTTQQRDTARTNTPESPINPGTPRLPIRIK